MLKYIFLLCLIIVIFTTLSSYKIESFINFSQLTVAKDQPQNANEFACFDYLKKIKNWNIDNYDEHQRKMISVMRTGLANRKTDLYDNTPFTESCVVPKEILDMFGISFKCTIDDHTLKHENYKPDGCTVDFRTEYNDEPKFKELLDKMNNNFNKKYIETIKQLKAELARLTNVEKNLIVQDNQYTNDVTSLEIDFSNKCSNDVVTSLVEYNNKPATGFVRIGAIDNGSIKSYVSDRLSKLKCKSNNELSQVTQTYNDELKKYNLYIYWAKAYEFKIDELTNIAIPLILEKISYLQNLYNYYSI